MCPPIKPWHRGYLLSHPPKMSFHGPLLSHQAGLLCNLYYRRSVYTKKNCASVTLNYFCLSPCPNEMLADLSGEPERKVASFHPGFLTLDWSSCLVLGMSCQHIPQLSAAAASLELLELARDTFFYIISYHSAELRLWCLLFQPFKTLFFKKNWAGSVPCFFFFIFSLIMGGHCS